MMLVWQVVTIVIGVVALTPILPTIYIYDGGGGRSKVSKLNKLVKPSKFDKLDKLGK